MKTHYQPTRETGGVTNKDRARWALIAAAAYADETGKYQEDLGTIVGDMLADLTHLATAAGYTPEEFLDYVTRCGRSHHQAESKGGEEEYPPDEEPEFLPKPVCGRDELLLEYTKDKSCKFLHG